MSAGERTGGYRVIDFSAVKTGTNLPSYARELVRVHDLAIDGGRTVL